MTVRMIREFLQSASGVVLGLLLLWSPGALAVTDCGLGLTLGAAPTIDGAEAAGEWSDAAVLTSASPCFQSLLDYVAATDTYPPRSVTVKSKRYQRDGTWYLGFLFAVSDLTITGPCTGGKVCIGEQIVMQFNQVINGDARLDVGQDRRFTLTHKWASTGNQVTDGVIAVAPPLTDATCPPVSTVDTKWGAPGADGISHAIQKNLPGGGYRAEIEVPVSFVNPAGTLATDIGVAFAVINDFGKNSFGGPPDFENCVAGGTCEGAGASFPLSLPENNDANPVGAICDKGWVIPKEWGVGYLTDPPAQVTISRLPNFWSSNGIQVFECDSATPGYTYYPDRPCRVRIQAELKNTGATATRKVLFLWSRHGMGDPPEYNFVDLKDAVAAPGSPGTPVSTFVTSGEWSGMPRHQANHPCLRAYIFPDTVSAADLDLLRGTATGGVVSRTTLMNVAATYGVQEQHWAQKNLSRHDTVAQCPHAACQVIGSRSLPIQFGLVRDAAAQTDSEEGTDRNERGAATHVIQRDELAAYAKDHVVVQVRAIASRIPRPGPKPPYSFVEEFGGVVQIFPVAMVRENRELPVTFDISNGSAEAMRVRILTEIQAPPGIPPVQVKIPKAVITLPPGGSLTVPGVLGQDEGGLGMFGWIALAVLLLILLILALQRRWP